MYAARSVVLLLLVLAGAPAFGQTVYRCRSGETWVFQDRPCGGNQTDAGTHNIRASKGGETPPAVKELLLQAQVNAERERNRAALAAAEPAAPAKASPQRKWYRCTAGRGFGERVVYQNEPCPEFMKTRFVSVSGTKVDDYGRKYPIEASRQVVEKSEQEEVSASEACDGLRAQQDPYSRYTNPRRCP